MFDSLDEQMAKDENKVSTPTERIMKWAIYLLAGLVVFGGVLYGVRNLG
jgi:hypothetical protein